MDQTESRPGACIERYLTRRYLWIWIALLPAWASPAQAGPWQDPVGAPGLSTPEQQTSSSKPTVKFSLTQYFDSRRFETATLFSKVDHLPLGLQLWGFTELHGNQSRPDGRLPLDRYFMEYRLLRPLGSSWLSNSDAAGAIAEYDDLNGLKNRVVRLGIYYQHATSLPGVGKAFLQWRVFPWESDGRGWQASVSYRVPLTNRVSVTGFADANLLGGGVHRWLYEPQLNVRLNEHLSAVTEFRYNGFERVDPDQQAAGVALGLRISP